MKRREEDRDRATDPVLCSNFQLPGNLSNLPVILVLGQSWIHYYTLADGRWKRTKNGKHFHFGMLRGTVVHVRSRRKLHAWSHP